MQQTLLPLNTLCEFPPFHHHICPARGRTGRDTRQLIEANATLSSCAAARERCSGSTDGAACSQVSVGARAGKAGFARGDRPCADRKRDSATAAAYASEAIVFASHICLSAYCNVFLQFFHVVKLIIVHISLTITRNRERISLFQSVLHVWRHRGIHVQAVRG